MQDKLLQRLLRSTLNGFDNVIKKVNVFSVAVCSIKKIRPSVIIFTMKSNKRPDFQGYRV